MIKLYSATVCPYAQRTRALLSRLGLPFEHVSIDLADRDPDFLRLTPTGKVPLLIHGDLKLYESQVINDYLAERYRWRQAYAVDAAIRARQRLAMKQWDARVLPAWYRGLRHPEQWDAGRRHRVDRELDEIESTVNAMHAEVTNLMALHVAPFWARIDWLDDYSPLAAMVRQRRHLHAWIARTVRLAEIEQTLPERAWAVQRYREHYIDPPAPVEPSSPAGERPSTNTTP